MKIRLERVHFMPKDLKPGVLYVSEEFGAAAHLCPCGCGTKIRTPLGPTDWSLEVTARGPTLHPSVGNWQQPCQSHYVIYKGEIIWCKKWSREQIAAGRRLEEEHRHVYYAGLYRHHRGALRRLWHWIKELI
jgi:hypothetical protein